MSSDVRPTPSTSNAAPDIAPNPVPDVAEPSERPLDLVGGPFAVIESDPGVFTSLIRRLGIQHLELVELYDIEPWAVDHLNPHGLIFCFMWRKDTHRPADFDDPAAERVWFANQLSDDACATHAILNVLLNCPDIDVGEELRVFRKETEEMSPVMKGLAITNSPILREAHNSLARPADIRAALNSLCISTLEAEKAKLKKAAQKQSAGRGAKPPPAKRAKTAASTKPVKGKAKENGKAKSEEDEEEKEEEEETYHFIGYVPAHGKVWELDGLKSGPLEVGELASTPSAPSTSAVGPSTAGSSSLPSSSLSHPTPGPRMSWMDIARPALRMKMDKYGGSGNDGSNIRFCLLAIVDDLFEKASDEVEFWRRDLLGLERRLGEGEDGWREKVCLLSAFCCLLSGTVRFWKVDPALLASAQTILFPNNTNSNVEAPVKRKTYAQDFASRRMQRDIEIMDMPQRNLPGAWEESVRQALRANVALEDELVKARRVKTEHIKRTWDYEPFFKEFITRLHHEGLLNPLLDRDANGRKKRGAVGKK
ncbi:hypothetical protein BDQ12DRAFT_634690 [Crucibulum laeve]|uniref:ubiquitinyl hydrolase 1 n=1 Tax=Crucibulum laeve TaxID=68775 RepID=A0A5C3LSU5_9AGAR|nr:hypothetical protein BDQ12DRAFT_634690 [Crucibulum laeve]